MILQCVSLGARALQQCFAQNRQVFWDGTKNSWRLLCQTCLKYQQQKSGSRVSLTKINVIPVWKNFTIWAADSPICCSTFWKCKPWRRHMIPLVFSGSRFTGVAWWMAKAWPLPGWNLVQAMRKTWHWVGKSVRESPVTKITIWRLVELSCGKLWLR